MDDNIDKQAKLFEEIDGNQRSLETLNQKDTTPVQRSLETLNQKDTTPVPTSLVVGGEKPGGGGNVMHMISV
ncbi:hypothetical protein Q3G72_019817 [Acer saccharum]|nr:hypothetical protein Q3G72_019817 [Acer saccharum]